MDDPGSGDFIFELVLLIVLILINALLSASETAIISLNDNKLERMALEGDKKAKRVQRLTKESSNFMATIQLCLNFTSVLIAAVAIVGFEEMLTAALCDLFKNASVPLMTALSVFIITLIVSFFSLVLGIMVPRKIAMQAPEKAAFAFAPFLSLVSKLAKPSVKLFSMLTKLFVKLFGYDPNASEEVVTEEEIRMMVDVGQEKGFIEDTQKEMINNIFEFDDMSVADIMTHRTDIEALEAEEPLADVVSLAIEHGYSRIPVYKDELDNVIGIAYIKDLLKYVGENLPKTKKMKDIIREAFYIPESLSCAKLFKEMSERHVQMAIVVDEYGGTAGLVTLEDLLEAIVGNIQDEYDNEDEDFKKIDEYTFTIDGAIDIEEVPEILGVEIPEGDYDTLGGFVIDLLGFLPKDGEVVETDYENIHFTVLNVEDRRIGKINAEISSLEKEENNQTE